MPLNQMTRNKDRPHSCAFAQVGRGIILESALRGGERHSALALGRKKLIIHPQQAGERAAPDELGRIGKTQWASIPGLI